MTKPLLILVTGRPASGKSTLAQLVARSVKCPLLSRDELKEGYLHGKDNLHEPSPDAVALHIYDTFFEAITLLLSNGISVVAEAAFQHGLWSPKLPGLARMADIRIIVCTVSAELAKKRFADRLLADPDREKFHGDGLLLSRTDSDNLLAKPYRSIESNFPTLWVDTTEDYDPDLAAILDFLSDNKSAGR